MLHFLCSDLQVLHFLYQLLLAFDYFLHFRTLLVQDTIMHKPVWGVWRIVMVAHVHSKAISRDHLFPINYYKSKPIYRGLPCCFSTQSQPQTATTLKLLSAHPCDLFFDMALLAAELLNYLDSLRSDNQIEKFQVGQQIAYRYISSKRTLLRTGFA
jgi:hypothetical protein